MKVTKNLLRDFPSPYDPEFWSEDGKTFNIALFNKKLYFKIHGFYAQIESAKKEFTHCPFLPCDKCEAKETCASKLTEEWFNKYIGNLGTGNGVLGLGR